jgi:hypothetical protein
MCCHWFQSMATPVDSADIGNHQFYDPKIFW